MRERFDSDYICSEFDRIGQRLDDSLTVFLIGGGAMAFRDLKNTTKDIDLFVSSGTDLGQLQATLLDLDYEIIREPSTEYDELGAQRIIENDERCRIDLFNQQVVDKLVLSDGIRGRSERYIETGQLTVALVSPEDIFLFKAVAGRTDDIEDMFALMQTGLEFAVVEDELTIQIELLGQEFFVTSVNEALDDLEARYNVTTPLHEPVAEIIDRVYRELEVLQALTEPISMAKLQTDCELSTDELEKTVCRLEDKGAVNVHEKRIERLSTEL
jgi:hypothetical protein